MFKVVLKKITLTAFISAVLLSATLAWALPGGSFVYPLIGTRVSSNFGKRFHPVLHIQRHHSGIDLAAPFGSSIRAVRAGTVIFADPHGSYGNLMVVQHENGMTSHYGHCKTIFVKTGQRVTGGQVLGTVGNTGISSGPHLHFEIRINGVAKNPEDYIPGLATEAVG